MRERRAVARSLFRSFRDDQRLCRTSEIPENHETFDALIHLAKVDVEGSNPFSRSRSRRVRDGAAPSEGSTHSPAP